MPGTPELIWVRAATATVLSKQEGAIDFLVPSVESWSDGLYVAVVVRAAGSRAPMPAFEEASGEAMGFLEAVLDVDGRSFHATSVTGAGGDRLRRHGLVFPIVGTGADPGWSAVLRLGGYASISIELMA